METTESKKLELEKKILELEKEKLELESKVLKLEQKTERMKIEVNFYKESIKSISDAVLAIPELASNSSMAFRSVLKSLSEIGNDAYQATTKIIGFFFRPFNNNGKYIEPYHKTHSEIYEAEFLECYKEATQGKIKFNHEKLLEVCKRYEAQKIQNRSIESYIWVTWIKSGIDKYLTKELLKYMKEEKDCKHDNYHRFIDYLWQDFYMLKRELFVPSITEAKSDDKNQNILPNNNNLNQGPSFESKNEEDQNFGFYKI